MRTGKAGSQHLLRMLVYNADLSLVCLLQTEVKGMSGNSWKRLGPQSELFLIPVRVRVRAIPADRPCHPIAQQN